MNSSPDAVLEQTRDFFARWFPNPEMQRLCQFAVEDMIERADGVQRIPSTALAIDVYRALAPTAPAAVGLGVLTTIIDAGIYLMDHVADGELGSRWAGRSSSDVALVWTTMLSALPALAVDALPLSAQVKVRLMTLIGARFVEIAEGQRADLNAPGRAVTLEHIDAAIDGKTGARRALFAEIGAIAAGADEATVEAIGRFGRALGRARQLGSDIIDLKDGARSRDLAAGTWTWPLAWLATQLEDDAQRDDLAGCLSRASRGDLEAAGEIIAALDAHNAHTRAHFEVQLARHHAREALQRAGLAPEVVEVLSPWLQDVALRPERSVAPPTRHSEAERDECNEAERDEHSEAPRDEHSAPPSGPGFRDVDADQDPERWVAFLRHAAGLDSVADARDRALALMAPSPGESILDVGCGLGDQIARVARAVAPSGRAVGVDASQTMINLARQEQEGVEGLELRTMDACGLEFEADRFDAVRFERILHLLPDPEAALREARRVLRPGGRCVIIEPDWRTLTIAGLDPDASHALTAQGHVGLGAGVVWLLKQCGFEDLHFETIAGRIDGAEDIEAMLSLDRRPDTPELRQARQKLRDADRDASAILTAFVVVAR